MIFQLICTIPAFAYGVYQFYKIYPKTLGQVTRELVAIWTAKPDQISSTALPPQIVESYGEIVAEYIFKNRFNSNLLTVNAEKKLYEIDPWLPVAPYVKTVCGAALSYIVGDFSYRLYFHDLLLSATNPAYVEWLIYFGVDVNERNKNGQTPLHIAINDKQLETVKFLIDNGANVRARDNNGRTPFHDAVKVKELAIMKLLNNYDIDIDARDNSNIKPLHIAKKVGCFECVKLIKSYGVRDDHQYIQDVDGRETLVFDSWSYNHDLNKFDNIMIDFWF